MALSIKDEATDRLVRRYARLKGLSYTRAVHVAMEKALDAERAEPPIPAAERAARVRESIRHIQDRVARLPIFDDRSADEILYDRDGLPR